MAIIHCTNTMAKWLGAEMLHAPFDEHVNIWNANLFRIERKNWLICVHKPTAYSVLFPEIKKSDMKEFELWFYPRLAEQLHYDKIPANLIAAYRSLPIKFCKSNNDKRNIGIMNRTVSELKYEIPDSGGMENNQLLIINHHINRLLVGGNPCIRPMEEMTDFLQSGL